MADTGMNLEIAHWLTGVLGTVAFLPLYLALRWPFIDLPLHVDTGFYVSNHTVCTGRIRFAKGWNAPFAACGKVLAEYFYSLIYQRHGYRSYKRMSRVYYGLVNYGSAILVGLLAWRLFGDGLGYFFGLGAYALLSSEPSWGGYFESGEQFEVPLQIAAIALIAGGYARGSAEAVGGGALIWALSAFFVKLSSLAGWFVLAGGAAVLSQDTVPWTAAALMMAVVLWIAWVRRNGCTVQGVLRAILAHESFYLPQTRRRMGVDIAYRIGDKSTLLASIVRRQPVLPVVAVLGLVVASRPVIWIYLCAAVVTYLLQAGRIWYYSLPLLPGLALACAGALRWLTVTGGWTGRALVILIGVMWVMQHAWLWHYRSRRHGAQALNAAVWHLYPSFFAQKNQELERFIERIRPLLRGASMLTFGMWSQSYVLAGTSYDTPYLVAADWLDTIAPDWREVLNRRIWEEPPAFILDTGRLPEEECLDTVAVSELGLRYSLVTADAGFRLFRFGGQAEVRGRLNARIYNPTVSPREGGSAP